MNIFQKIKLRNERKKHIRRPLDINESLSRSTDRNVVADAYEFYMRLCEWDVDNSFNATVKTFLLCVAYDGEIANGGISQFLANHSGKYAHQTADALHTIGALDSERLLRKSFLFFKNGTVPEDDDLRNQMLDEKTDSVCADSVFAQLDIASYNGDTVGYCYKYLMANKDKLTEQA